MSLQIRILLFLAGVVTWVGIYMSGLETVHWVLFLPASFFLFASLTGICPGLVLFQKYFARAEIKKKD